MSAQFRLTLVWLLGALVVLTVTLQMGTASFIDGQYQPVGHDAFYHGRRILDAVASGHLFQFDPLMHVPEGDWVTWPWAYDLVLAKAVQALRLVFPTADPAAVLMSLPPLLGLVGSMLIVAVCAELKLTISLTLLAVLAFGFSAFTQYPFGIGALDHHGAEQLATLGSLWLGLRWLSAQTSVTRAAVAGLGLGLALGIHAGLFILQIPLLAALLHGWWHGERLPTRTAGFFAAGLLTGTLAILLPAATFWQSRFVIYYLSWLHLYIALSTCIVVAFISRRPVSRPNLAWLAVVGAALAAPLLATILFSGDFLSGNLAQISNIDEIQSLLSVAMQMPGTRRIMQVYTHLIWVAPVTLVVCVWMALKANTSRNAFFWLNSAFGLALLLAQLRLGSFGAAFLYLPLLMLAQVVVTSRPEIARVVMTALVIALVLAYYPTLRYQLFGEKVAAMDQQYVTLRPVLPVLRDACARDPGVVLAEPGEGHLVRYFTKCSVISNNFRLTPTDVEKVKESLDLISQPLDSVRRRAPEVKYVIARLVRPNESPNPVLFHQLLATGQPRPPGVEALVELTVTHPDGQSQRFMGVYRLDATSPPPGRPAELGVVNR